MTEARRAPPSSATRAWARARAGASSRRARGLAAGLAFALAAPPSQRGALAFVALAALASALDEDDTPRDAAAATPRSTRAAAWRGARVGLAFGAAANVVALRFVPDVVARFTPLPWAAGLVALGLVAVAQGAAWMAGGAVVSALRARGVALVPAFAAGVFVAALAPGLFPWSAAGTLVGHDAYVQMAAVVGERGLAVLLATAAGAAASAAGLVVRALRAGAVERGAGGGRRALLAAAGFAAAAGALAVATHHQGRRALVRHAAEREAAPRARVALVGPAFGASERWDPARAARMMARLTELTRAAEAKGAELTVWPESAYPYTLAHATRTQPTGPRALLPFGVRGPVLTGVYLSKGAGLGTNSVLLAHADGSLSAPHDKRHLVLFGEWIPFADRLPLLRETFAKGQALVAGTHTVPLATPDGRLRIAALVCFEDTLPEAGREVHEAAPNLVVNVTNDAWFAGSQEPALHLALARLRAVESGRELLRAVNGGPSAHVGAGGELLASRWDDVAGTLVVDAARLDGPPTPYARFGDGPSLALLVAACGTPLLGRARATRARGAQKHRRRRVG